jgi:hypothetical protein
MKKLHNRSHGLIMQRAFASPTNIAVVSEQSYLDASRGILAPHAQGKCTRPQIGLIYFTLLKQVSWQHSNLIFLEIDYEFRMISMLTVNRGMSSSILVMFIHQNYLAYVWLRTNSHRTPPRLERQPLAYRLHESF